MGLATLRVGQLLQWQGATFRLEGKSASSSWFLTEIRTGATDLQPESTLLEQYEIGELKFLSDGDRSPAAPDVRIFDALSPSASVATPGSAGDDAAKIACHRLSYVQQTLGLSGDALTAKIAAVWKKEAWPDKPPSSRTIYSWRNKVQGTSDLIAALRSRDELKGRTGDRYSAEVMDVVRDIRDSYFLKQNPRISVAKAVKRIHNKLLLDNQTRPTHEAHPLPGRKLFERVLSEIPEREILASRYGRHFANNALRFSLGGKKLERPLERVQIDHTRLGIFLLDEDFSPWGRANLTPAIDQTTTAVLGYYVGPEEPSTVSVARAIRQSVQPKIALLKEHGSIRSTWETFGVAETYVVDNGLEMHSAALRQACSQLGAQAIEFCASHSGWQKAQVERHFRTLDKDLLQGLPGATMENIQSRPDFNPKKDLLIRRSTFSQILLKWVVDVYMRTRKESLDNLSPAEAWVKAMGATEIVLPTQTLLLEQLFFRKVEGRVIDHEGLLYDCIHYNSAEVGRMRSEIGHKLDNVSILVSDEDLAFIYVSVPGHAIWLKVPAVDQAYARGLTRWQHAKCKKLRRITKDEGNAISLAEAEREIDELIKQEGEALSRHRRRRSRFKERPNATRAGDDPGTPLHPAESTEKGPPSADFGGNTGIAEVPVFSSEVW